MAFHEIRLPDRIAYGVSGGPEFSTTVVATAAGYEYRNQNWAEARGRWTVGSGLKKPAEAAELIAFFRARGGRAHGFRFKDFTDYQASAQVIGSGDGETKTFQLIKRYASGATVVARKIAKPVAGTARVTVAGQQQASGWWLDATTGLVTFATAPAVHAAVTAEFEFDVPVRFDTDRMELRIENVAHLQWPGIQIVELKI